MKRFITIMMIGVFALIISRVPNSLWSVWLLQLPGTILHEIAHATVAFLCQANPHDFNLLPKHEDGAWTLGSIRFNVTSVNAASVALAPLLLIPAAIILTFITFKLRFGVAWFASCYVSAAMLLSSIPSKPDFLVALSYPLSWLPALVTMGLWYYLVYLWIRPRKSAQL